MSMQQTFAKSNLATGPQLHRCWVAAPLCQLQIYHRCVCFTQDCSQPVLHSSSTGVHFAQSSDAVHGCWVAATFCEQQIFTSVLAVTHEFC